MRLTLKHIFLLPLVALLFIANNNLSAQQDEFAKPKKEQLVYDNAKVFTTAELSSINNKLSKFSRETSTQILVYTAPTLNGYSANDFAQRIGEAYGVGSKENDNGIVIVFKPKNDQPGQVAIQVGYGIEHLIPDATANQIIDNEMIPAFKQGDISGGIVNAVNICISLTKGEYTAQHYQEKTQGSAGGGAIILIIFLITFFSMFGRSRRSRYGSMGTRSNLPLLAALLMMGGGSHRGSGFSDFSSGSGSFGGGGGFGGFGGGGFGGGGASGSW